MPVESLPPAWLSRALLSQSTVSSPRIGPLPRSVGLLDTLPPKPVPAYWHPGYGVPGLCSSHHFCHAPGSVPMSS